MVAAIADDYGVLCLLIWQEIFHFSKAFPVCLEQNSNTLPGPSRLYMDGRCSLPCPHLLPTPVFLGHNQVRLSLALWNLCLLFPCPGMLLPTCPSSSLHSIIRSPLSSYIQEVFSDHSHKSSFLPIISLPPPVVFRALIISNTVCFSVDAKRELLIYLIYLIHLHLSSRQSIPHLILESNMLLS